jgi:hypothetical protein
MQWVVVLGLMVACSALHDIPTGDPKLEEKQAQPEKARGVLCSNPGHSTSSEDNIVRRSLGSAYLKLRLQTLGSLALASMVKRTIFQRFFTQCDLSGLPLQHSSVPFHASGVPRGQVHKKSQFANWECIMPAIDLTDWPDIHARPRWVQHIQTKLHGLACSQTALSLTLGSCSTSAGG